MSLPVTPSELTALGSFIQNMFVSGAALTTAVVAWKGLNKWQDETTFKANFELAKEVIEETYKLRNVTEPLIYPFLLSCIDENYENNNLVTYVKPALESLKDYDSLIVRVKALFDEESIYNINAIRSVTEILIATSEDMYNAASEYASTLEHIAMLENGYTGDQMEIACDSKNEALRDLSIYSPVLKKVYPKESKEIEKLSRCLRFKHDNFHVSLDAFIEELADSLRKYLKR
jgi:hypothetical protein